LQNRLIQTGQTGGQWYSDPSPFSIPWTNTPAFVSVTKKKSFITFTAGSQKVLKVKLEATTSITTIK